MAHASDQALVLLLPTDIYTGAGVAVVAATVLLLTLMPARITEKSFATLGLGRWRPRLLPLATSCLSCVTLLLLIVAGAVGPRDPLANPLPLSVWTLFWIGLVTLQGVLGNVWAWLNPWSGPVTLLRHGLGLPTPRIRGATWTGPVTFLAFAGFLLADPAPSDPDRLAAAVAIYFLLHLALALVFGDRWLARGEGLTLALTALARVGAFGRAGGRLRIGLPGWQLAAGRAPAGIAVISVLLLGAGSFDGLNETFWWLDRLGLNPFEYPGRSAVVSRTIGGLLTANLVLFVVLGSCLWAGLRLAGAATPLPKAFGAFAPTLLPIALGYHVAHYLPSFLVKVQYALVAFSDPFLNGADLLGLGDFYVTTGFFNTTGSVRMIYLTQATAVVAGHVLSILTAHAVAMRLFASRRTALQTQAPLTLFMIGYTFFGLWLLASPRL